MVSFSSGEFFLNTREQRFLLLQREIKLSEMAPFFMIYHNSGNPPRSGGRFYGTTIPTSNEYLLLEFL
jgi:hypothetical protein